MSYDITSLWCPRCVSDLSAECSVSLSGPGIQAIGLGHFSIDPLAEPPIAFYFDELPGEPGDEWVPEAACVLCGAEFDGYVVEWGMDQDAPEKPVP